MATCVGQCVKREKFYYSAGQRKDKDQFCVRWSVEVEPCRPLGPWSRASLPLPLPLKPPARWFLVPAPQAPALKADRSGQLRRNFGVECKRNGVKGPFCRRLHLPFSTLDSLLSHVFRSVPGCQRIATGRGVRGAPEMFHCHKARASRLYLRNGIPQSQSAASLDGGRVG